MMNVALALILSRAELLAVSVYICGRSYGLALQSGSCVPNPPRCVPYA
jgi:hypothetical protein